MKRTLIAILTFVLFVSMFFGCADSHSYINEDDGIYSITLPYSKETIEISEEYEYYVSRITDELIEDAEKKLEKDLEQYSSSSNSGYYLSLDRGGHLCLTVEVIVSIDPPADVSEEIAASGDCNIDHKHIMLSERISE